MAIGKNPENVREFLEIFNSIDANAPVKILDATELKNTEVLIKKDGTIITVVLKPIS